MIRIALIASLLAFLSMHLVSCGSGDATSPDGGDDIIPTGTAFTIPPYEVLRHGFDLKAVWASSQGLLSAGEQGWACVSTPAGRYLLPTLRTEALTACWVDQMSTVFHGTANSYVQWFKDGRRQSQMLFAGVKALMGAYGDPTPYPVYAFTEFGDVYAFMGDGWERKFDNGSGILNYTDFWANNANCLWTSCSNGLFFGDLRLFDPNNYVKYLDGWYDALSAIACDSVLAVGGGPGAWGIQMLAGMDFDFHPVYNSESRLRDVHWVDDDYAIAVGDDGTSVIYDGASWDRQTVFPPVHLTAVSAFKDGGDRRAVAVGDSGGTFTYALGQWTGAACTKITCTELMGVSPDVLFALRQGRLMKLDGQWEELPQAGNLALHDFYCLAEDDIWAIGAQGIDTFVCHYDGAVWQTWWLSSMGQAHEIWVADDGRVFVAGDYGTVYSNYYGSWAPMSAVQPVEDLSCVWGASASSVYVAGKNGAIAHWDGSLWTAMVSGTSSDLIAISGSSDDCVAALTYSGPLLVFDGDSWSAVDIPDVELADYKSFLWCSGPNSIWVGKANGRVGHYDGSAWERRDTQLDYLLHTGMWGQGDDLWLMGEYDLLLRYRLPPADLIASLGR